MFEEGVTELIGIVVELGSIYVKVKFLDDVLVKFPNKLFEEPRFPKGFLQFAQGIKVTKDCDGKGGCVFKITPVDTYENKSYGLKINLELEGFKYYKENMKNG